MKSNAICAIATAKGSSALGVIRISGDDLNSLLSHLFTKKLSDRRAILTDVKFNDVVFDMRAQATTNRKRIGTSTSNIYSAFYKESISERQRKVT